MLRKKDRIEYKKSEESTFDFKKSKKYFFGKHKFYGLLKNKEEHRQFSVSEMIREQKKGRRAKPLDSIRHN